MADGRGCERCGDVVDLVPGLGRVHEQPHPAPPGQRLGLLQGVVRHRVGRVDEQGRGDERVPVLPAVEEPGRGLDVAARVGHARGREVDDPLGGHTAQAGIQAGARRLVLEEVAVGHAGHPGEQQFGRGQPAAPVHRLRVDVAGLGREDVVGEPVGQRQVVGQTAEQGHGQVTVAVDQAGQGELSLSVHHGPCPPGRTVGHGPEGVDAAIADKKEARSVHEIRVRFGENPAGGDEQVVGHNCLRLPLLMVYHRVRRPGRPHRLLSATLPDRPRPATATSPAGASV